jgi:glycosyltransferase involved in cell wall biosynthesis
MRTGLKGTFRRIKAILVEAMLDGASTLRIVRAKLVRGERSRTTQRRRILVVDEMVPDARFGAGYPRAAEILYALVDAGWDVTMYPMIASAADHAMIRSRFATLPVHFVLSRGPKGLQRLMRENRDTFDVTLISRPENMRIYSQIRSTLGAFRTHCVYDAEAIFAVRDLRRLEIFGRPMTTGEYDRALNREIDLVRDADALTTVTETEAALFRERSGKPVHVVKHSIAVRTDTPGFDQRTDFLFVGRCAGPRELSPNVDSLYWFVREVMPLIDAAMNAAYRLVVVGLADPDIVSALGSDRVVFMGVVDNLDAIYDRCRVFVAPTRFAAGMPLKVVEAAGLGIPCVVTELLEIQLGFRHGVELLAARDATEFAIQCVALYEHPDQWVRVKNSALARVLGEYSRAQFGAAVRAAIAFDAAQ